MKGPNYIVAGSDDFEGLDGLLVVESILTEWKNIKEDAHEASAEKFHRIHLILLNSEVFLDNGHGSLSFGIHLSTRRNGGSTLEKIYAIYV